MLRRSLRMARLGGDGVELGMGMLLTAVGVVAGAERLGTAGPA